MLCEPTVRALVDSVAVVPTMVPEPRDTPLSRKLTVPVGVEPETVAVNVTGAPKAAEAPEVVTATLEVVKPLTT